MRQIINMIMDVALEDNRSNNKRVAELKEVYPYYDEIVSGRASEARLSEALVVGHFPLYFARTLSRVVLDRYQYQKGQWRDYCYMDMAPDYTAVERFSFTEFDAPVLRRDKEEARAGWIAESHLTAAVDDYAKQIDFSRRILKNDDLGAFNQIAQKMGDSVSRFTDWYVSALYDNALTQAALIALGANYAGTGRLTTANLGIAWNAFVSRVDGRGNPLNIIPTYLVIPPILELTANQILTSERIAELATNGNNPMRGRLQVKLDPYIATAAPNVPWYLMADPSSVPTVGVVRMQGMTEDFRLYAKAPDKMPMSVSGSLGAADWRDGSYLTGDIELEVETTIGCRNDAAATLVGVYDAQSMYYSSGTTA